MAEESARVAQRCEAGKESLELLLDGCDLRKFPDAVFFLMREVELQRVSLAHNQLQRIPSKLGLKFTTITGDLCSYKPQATVNDDGGSDRWQQHIVETILVAP
jgi:hypothetical protein